VFLRCSDINDIFTQFQNARALGFADDLKLFMNLKNTDDCEIFQKDIDRMFSYVLFEFSTIY
jgi:hypothetical protein